MKTKYLLAAFAAIGIGAFIQSCSDDYPDAVDSPYPTELISISIINGGADGATTYEGRIDEDKKIIDFKRFDPATDFSALKVKAEISDGAALEKDVFDFSMGEDAEKTLILRIKNHNRYKDYFIRVRKKVPVFGADWEKPSVYAFTGENIYPDCASSNTRWADFDGEHVLVVSRDGGVRPHLLRVSDLKAGKTDSPVMLDVTSVTGGTFPVSCGALVNGHVYVSNLCGGGKFSPLKIYYWDEPSSQPEVILNSVLTDDVPEADRRHGDNASFNVDENGNGYVFFGSNNEADMLRYSVSGNTTVDSPKVLRSHSGANAYTTFNRIGNTSEYVWSGIYMAPILSDENAAVNFTVSGLSGKEITASRILYFNSERYLLTCSADRSGSNTATMRIFDITKGNDVKDALDILNKGSLNPVYEFSLGGAKNTSPGTTVNYSIKKGAEGKDSVLSVFAFRTSSGFVIVDFPAKIAEDD